MPADARGRPGASTGKRLSHILLDIEGTTCPVSFVADTLFPYARDQLDSFLVTHTESPQVQSLLKDVETAWARDNAPHARDLWRSRGGHRASASAGPEASEQGPSGSGSAADPPEIAAYLRWLMENDRKLTALKELQGMIWASGYASGQLVAPLFPEVAACLRRWVGNGIVLAVYSSGSVAAQQLLYQYSSDGDLRALFSAWFDTRIGAKQEASSYERIADTLGIPAAEILFISDAPAELMAAQAVGMAVLYRACPGRSSEPPLRDGPADPTQVTQPIKAIKDFREVTDGNTVNRFGPA